MRARDDLGIGAGRLESWLDRLWTRFAIVALDSFVAFSGLWTLLCWGLVAAGASFRTLLWLSWLPLAATLWVVLRRPQVDEVEALDEGPSLRRTAFVLAVGGICLATLLSTGSYTLFWLLAAAALLVELTRARRVGVREPQVRLAAAGGGILLLTCLVAMVITLIAHRSDRDDSFYLNLVVTALDRPQEPLLSGDGLFGEPDKPLLESWYRLRSYELGVAVLTQLSRLESKHLYYFFFPACFAVLVVIAHWSAMRSLGGGAAVLGSVLVVVALLAWGDLHRAYGNFSFVRLFQGKAVIVSVWVPTVIAYAWRFGRNPGRRSWWMLLLAQIGAVGMSGSALVAVPAAALAMLVAQHGDRGLRPLLLGVSAGIPLLFAAGLVASQARAANSSGIGWDELATLPSATEQGVTYALGRSPLSLAALAALVAAPLLTPGTARRTATVFVLLLLIIVLNPLSSGSLGSVASRLSWRVFWAVPFPLLLGLAGERLVAAGRGWWRFGFAVAIVGVLLAQPRSWTLSPANGTVIDWPRWKVPREHGVAARIVADATPSDLVLAPFEVSAWIPTFRRHPRLVGTRKEYFGPVARLSEEEVFERRALVELVSTSASDFELAERLELLKRRQVDIVVFDPELPHAAGLKERLRRCGCSPGAELLDGYELWRCEE